MASSKLMLDSGMYAKNAAVTITLLTAGAIEGRKNTRLALSRPVTKKTIAKVVFQLLGTLFLRHNIVKEEDLRTLVQNLFNFNQMDENGNLSERLVTPRYFCPVSQYP